MSWHKIVTVQLLSMFLLCFQVSLIGNNPCVHKAAVPVGYTSNKDESAHGTLSSPVIMEIWSSLLWIGTRITRIL